MRGKLKIVRKISPFESYEATSKALKFIKLVKPFGWSDACPTPTKEGAGSDGVWINLQGLSWHVR